MDRRVISGGDGAIAIVEQSLGRRLEQLVTKLFENEGFQILNEPRGQTASVPDLLIRSHTGATAIVEIKVYRSRFLPLSTLNRASDVVESYRRAFEADRAIIATTSKVDPLVRQAWRPNFPNLVIYDIDALAFLAAKEPALFGALEDITREALAFSSGLDFEPEPVEISIEADISRRQIAPDAQPVIPDLMKGHDLCEEINAIPFGKRGAKTFEEKVTEALQYIFDKDLTAWSPQQATATKLHFYDLVARVASAHDFWNAIASQFQSRYIIFEFKNYKDRIKQNQIYTTEKYLFLSALRSTAIIISRKGADNNALAAARGALRESGKLIINLDIKDLCAMPHRKDKGDDHNTVLFERIDDMLMRVER